MTATFTPHPKPVREPKPAKGPRQKRCTVRTCRAPFAADPARPFVMWCSEVCGHTVVLAKIAAAKASADRARRAAAKADRNDTRARKEKAKKRSKHVAETQAAFNSWVRARDADLPCICCGKFASDEALTGGGWDAGHYLSRGSHPHLRFDERNVFRQRKGCNRPGGTTAASFRLGVIKRIGLAAVEALEADQAPRKWSIEELNAIKATYRAKLKALTNSRESA